MVRQLARTLWNVLLRQRRRLARGLMTDLHWLVRRQSRGEQLSHVAIETCAAHQRLGQRVPQRLPAAWLLGEAFG